MDKEDLAPLILLGSLLTIFAIAVVSLMVSEDANNKRQSELVRICLTQTEHSPDECVDAFEER